MDAARYARVRELFLAAEELPPTEQQGFLRDQTAGDPELFEEVNSLLAEHDPELARREGERVLPHAIGAGAAAHAASPVAEQSEDTMDQGGAGAVTQPGHRAPRKSSDVTRHGPERTHATPRHRGTPLPPSSPHTRLWQQRHRQHRRRNSSGLWLAALLPTVVIGWWTCRRVESTLQHSVRQELNSLADGLALASDQYLRGQVQLVESWSRQPAIRDAVAELVEMARRASDPAVVPDASHSGPDQSGPDQSDQIQAQLRSLSGSDEVTFVVWNDSFRVIASGRPDAADVGSVVHPSGASDLARVMAGATVLFGPERLTGTANGFLPETDGPVMVIIVPIRDRRGDLIAAMLVGGIGIYDQFRQTFSEIAEDGRWDAYAVGLDATMVTASPHATALALTDQLNIPAAEIACRLRVADPGPGGEGGMTAPTQRSTFPLTKSVASVTLGDSGVLTTPYRNYAGQDVVGAWRWIEPWNLGIIVEQQADSAFAVANIVWLGFVVLAGLLTLTALTVAAWLARVATAEHAAVHPLSRYELISELGSGGMGVVYRVRHRHLGRDTALKLLHGDRQTKEDRLRFDREARLAASLRSPHAVTIYDYGHSDDGESFCVMELLQGLTLQEVVARSGPQPVGRVLYILSQICEALSEAHVLNLLHRDIKPQNIMLSCDGAVGDWAVVFDFGLAKPLQPAANVYQTSASVWSGTPMYMAPERFRAPSQMDPRSDIYSLGCVAYFLLSGRPPFVESHPESLFAQIISEQPISIGIHRGEEIAPEVHELVFTCMAKAAGDRFGSVAALAQRIDRLRGTYPWTVEQARQWWRDHGGD